MGIAGLDGTHRPATVQHDEDGTKEGHTEKS